MEEKIICGRYEIIDCIGQGGMAKVYRVNDRKLSKIWAMKEILIDNENNEIGNILAKSIMDEIKILKKLDHPGMPRIVDTVNIDYENKVAIYVVMDYIEGRNLSEILETEYYINEEMAVKIILEICEVLIYLHRQSPPIIYRDMKPENIIIDKNGRAKLIDFGIAREYKEDSAYDTVRLGTKEYAAPEQYSKDIQTDERTDIYSLGVTFLKMLTGSSQLKDAKKNLRKKHISNNLIKIIQKSIQKNSINRYQSVDKFQKELISYSKNDKKQLANAYICLIVYRVCNVILLFSVCLIIWSNEYEKKYFEELYAKNKQIISTSANYDARKKAMLEIINIEPENIENYEQLLELYCEDQLFDENEEKEILDIMSGEEIKNISKSHLATICYRLGVLYWNYYYYGQMGITGRIKASSEWFQKSIDYGVDDERKEKAMLYSLIGEFYKKQLQNMDEMRDEDYLEIYENIKKLYLLESDTFGNQEKTAINVLIEIVKNNEEKILNAGVNEAEYLKIMDAMRGRVK